MVKSEDVAAFRRTALIGLMTRCALMAAVVAGLAMLVFSVGSGYVAAGLFAGASLMYLYLGWRSLGVSRRALIGPELMARGQLEDAEQVFTASVRQFTLFPVHRVVELLHLAELRFRQGRYLEAVQIAREVMGVRGRVPPEVVPKARLLHLEALLELRDLPAAHAAILGLLPMEMSVVESARFILARTWYEALAGADGHVLHELGAKLHRVKLLQSDPQAEFCILAGRSAERVGRRDLADFLYARARALLGVSFDRVRGEIMADMSGVALVTGHVAAGAGPIK